MMRLQDPALPCSEEAKLRKSMRSALIAAFIIQAVAQATGLFAQTLQPAPSTFLRQQLAFSPADLATLEPGQIIVKLPRTPEAREVVAFSIVRLDVSGDFFVEKV